MLRFKYFLWILFVAQIGFAQKKTETNIKSFVWNEHKQNLKGKDVEYGIAAFDGADIQYRKNGNPLLRINISDPVLVYEAEKSEPWGFVQFPRIFRATNNRIVITWNMANDDITANKKIGWKYSKDNGNNWSFNWNDRPIEGGIKIPNGDEIKMVSFNLDEKKMVTGTPLFSQLKASNRQSVNLYESKDLNDAVNKYLMNRKKRGSNKYIQEKVNVMNNQNVLRASINGVIPNITWGPMKVMPNGQLLKVIYPLYLKNVNDGDSRPSSIGFYQSKDDGYNWELKSFIPYKSEVEGLITNRTDEIDGFTEPTFEVLTNGKIVSAIRSSSGYKVAPMYMSSSSDYAESWTEPKAVAKNGVSPQLKQLGNKIIVLTSGRPGVQMRFSLDQGASWTDAVDFLRFKGIAGQVSCGYTGILELSNNEFLVVYSDFKHRNSKGQTRKAILVRKVKVDRL